MGDIKITDLHKIHETDEVRDKYQIFHTEGGRVLQSMVLTVDEIRDLYWEVKGVLNELK